MTKTDFLADFASLNRRGIDLATATETALRAERERDFRPQLPGGITVGLSSGTSGTRHVFLVDRADRCRWAGQILARTLSADSLRQILNPFREPLRIAFFLRANSNLYTTLGGRRVGFVYHDLTRPFGTLLREVEEQDPHVIVAPATVLAELARRRPGGLRPRQVLSVAEVLDERDRSAVEDAFGTRVLEIYQATEGFLGVSCAEGRIHLNEEDLHIEKRWLDGKLDRFHPVITDFSRSGQWFVRHLLNDILRPSDGPCPCGRATLALDRIEGRAEEVLHARDEGGAVLPVFPDSVRQALYSMETPPGLYRIEEHGDLWEIRLHGGGAALESGVADALTKLLLGLGLVPPGFRFCPWTEQSPGEKQKRLRCVLPPE